MSKAIDILTQHQLRVTPCRIFVLQELMRKKSKSCSELDLEQKSKGEFDRVTIYRTLKTFVESDIIHKILDDQQAVKYALCKEDHNHQHNHDHVHFKCNSCETTNCLDDVKVENIKLPAGYKKQEINYLIIGTCPECA